jgi:hypothetical protein
VLISESFLRRYPIDYPKKGRRRQKDEIRDGKVPVVVEKKEGKLRVGKELQVLIATQETAKKV